MRKYLWMSVCVLMMLLMASGTMATAEKNLKAPTKLGDVVLGAWSSWSTNERIPSPTLEVETREIQQQVIKEVWKYRRYVYFNNSAQKWYATCTETPGSVMKKGSGYWEEKVFDEPLHQIGIVNEEQAYEGQWFFEENYFDDSGTKTVLQYRSRSKRLTACVLNVHDVALGRGESYTMSMTLADGVKELQYESSDPSVATVNPAGVVTAKGIGRADINVMYGDQRVEQLHVAVGDRIAGLESGTYVIQLIGTDEYLAPAAGSSKPGTSFVASSTITPDKRYFKFMGAASKSFKIRLVSPQVVYLSIKGDEPKLRVQGQSNKFHQAFSLLRLQGGQDLIHLTGNSTKFLTVVGKGQVELREFDILSTEMRWKLIKVGEDQAPPTTWILPYQLDGKSYVSSNYVAGVHKGMDIGSDGERVNALAVAPGKVVHVFSGCAHDYGKAYDDEKRLYDPCGSYNSFGNLVIVQHENGIRTYYAHLSRTLVNVGDRVNQGDVIGITGATGSSTAVHLHFEVRSGDIPMNPRQFIKFPAVKKD